jgi:hypothetical protein
MTPPDTSTGSLQEDPPTPQGDTTEPAPPDTSGTPVVDGNPDGLPLNNPDPDPDTSGATGSNDGSESPPEEQPPEETPEDPPPPNPCPDGIANPFGTRCYFVSTELASWAAARTACQAWGGDLVIMDAPFEDGFVGTLSDQSVWIGGSDTQFDNTYLWVDGRPMPGPGQSGGNWGPQQPNAFVGSFDCIEKRQEQLEPWYDQPCDAPLNYVCEKAPVQQPAAQQPAAQQPSVQQPAAE